MISPVTTVPLAFFMILSILIKSTFSQPLSHNSSIHSRFDEFFQTHWKHDNWKGASTWTGDVTTRLTINYLFFLADDKHSQVDKIFTRIVSRSLNRWTLLQYFTQGYDDFGWTVFSLLEILRYTHHYEERYPHSSVIYRLPIIRKRLVFRAAFLHDTMQDSWSTELCGGGAEWKVRGRKHSLWPALDFGGVYKNSITNHLYNANSAQIFNASVSQPIPSEITELGLHYVRLFWKSTRPFFGWPRGRLRYFNFADMNILYQAINGLKWMKESHLLTDDSLYMDGKRPRYTQSVPEERPEALCDAIVPTLFTYNQVSGIRALRYLSRVSRNAQLIEQGHDAIQALINSTYHGRLGSHGILEDVCDKFGNCTQDMQVFKALPFLDISNYCEPVEWLDREVQTLHRRRCSDYCPWIEMNAAAAQKTIDISGRFGGYWGSDSTQRPVQLRSLETHVAGLSVLLSSAWFKNNFS